VPGLWFEVFLGGTWYTFDARHNTPRIGRVLVARGRDAADVATSTTFGSNRLLGFSVVTEEVPPSCRADHRHNRDDDAQAAEPASTMMYSACVLIPFSSPRFRRNDDRN